MQIVCNKSLFTVKVFKMSTICTDTYLEMLSPVWSFAVSTNVRSEIGPKM